jgi:hypothetical protein
MREFCVIPGGVKARLTSFLFSLSITFSVAAQQVYDPISPFQPRSAAECSEFHNRWNGRVDYLVDQLQRAERRITDNCGTDTGCLVREHCHDCSPEKTECGDMFYQYSRNRMSAWEVAYAQRHRAEQVQKCMDDVDQYHQAEEKKRSDAAAANEKRLQEEEADRQRKASAAAVERKKREDIAAAKAHKRTEDEKDAEEESVAAAASEEASQASAKADRTKREAEEKLASQRLAQRGNLNASNVRQSTPEITVPKNQSESVATPDVKEDTRVKDTLEQMVDPFEASSKPKPKNSKTDGDLLASSAATSGLVDPFPNRKAKVSSRGTLEENAEILGDLVEQREKDLDYEMSIARHSFPLLV